MPLLTLWATMVCFRLNFTLTFIWCTSGCAEGMICIKCVTEAFWCQALHGFVFYVHVIFLLQDVSSSTSLLLLITLLFLLLVLSRERIT